MRPAQARRNHYFARRSSNSFIFVEHLLGALFQGLYKLAQHLYYVIYIEKKLKKLLAHYSPFYNQLVDKEHFEDKVWEFIRNNQFEGRKGLRVTLTLKSIIAAHAVQLSLNLEDEAYDYYDKILLYKDYYLSRITNKYHKGEVNPGFKIIVLSVRAIHESINRPDDGLNVMLHEFAHALWLEQKLMANEYNVFEEIAFQRTVETIDSEIERLRATEDHFFRNYAFTNKAEFFAVAVENFFERSEQFNEALPELYSTLSTLFRQDPLRMKRRAMQNLQPV